MALPDPGSPRPHSHTRLPLSLSPHPVRLSANSLCATKRLIETKKRERERKKKSGFSASGVKSCTAPRVSTQQGERVNLCNCRRRIQGVIRHTNMIINWPFSLHRCNAGGINQLFLVLGGWGCWRWRHCCCRCGSGLAFVVTHCKHGSRKVCVCGLETTKFPNLCLLPIS